MAKKAYIGVNLDTNEYEVLQYIESSGTQVIDTGFKHNQNTRFVADFETTFVDNSGYNYPFGSYGGSSYSDGKFFVVEIKTNATNFTALYKNEQYTFSSALAGRHHLDMNKTVHTLDNESHAFGSGSFSAGTNFCLFGSGKYTGDNPQIAPCSKFYFKLYSAKLYDNGTLIRDFIPVRRKSDNEICLYDLVNQQFYTNVGTGTFIAGPSLGSVARNIKKMYVCVPETYTVVDYIESSGTQYIDTNVVMTNDISAELDFQLTSITTLDHNSIIAAFLDGVGSGFVFAQRSNNGNFAVAYGSGWNSTEVSADLLRHTVKINENGECTLDNQVLISSPGSSGLNSGLSILIGGWWRTGQVGRRGYFKTYSGKIYDNGVLVRDFVPVVDSNNVACLFDKVTNRAYYNQGTGTFTAGTTTSEQISADVVKKITKGYVGVKDTYSVLDYIESNGTQYIDTSIIPVSTTKLVLDIAFTDITDVNRVGWASTTECLCVGLMGASDTNFKACCSSNTNYINVGVKDTARHVFELSNSGILQDGVSYGAGNLGDSSTGTFLLFARRVSWSSDIQYAKCKIYSCKMYDNGNLIRDFTPVLDNNNAVCLLDKVNNVAYCNLGSGSFAAGIATGETIEVPTAREFYSTYTPQTYLQSSGTQYIDTGMKFFSDLCTEIKFQATNLTPGYDWGVGAAENIGSSTYYYLPIAKGNGVSYFEAHRTTENTAVNTWTADTNIHTVKFAYRTSPTATPQYNWDGSSKGNLATYTATSTYNVPLFARNWKGTINKGHMKIFYCKMYNSVTWEMYRDFIPVLDGDGVPCLYDKVTDEFYYNVGTGTFLYG